MDDSVASHPDRPVGGVLVLSDLDDYMDGEIAGNRGLRVHDT
ncbi:MULTISPECIES: hypothetical protein [unclassified Bifidobacterium]|nr:MULTISPECIES: hypothetical protein [unclassified Bifidobacterium]